MLSHLPIYSWMQRNSANSSLRYFLTRYSRPTKVYWDSLQIPRPRQKRCLRETQRQWNYSWIFLSVTVQKRLPCARQDLQSMDRQRAYNKATPHEPTHSRLSRKIPETRHPNVKPGPVSVRLIHLFSSRSHDELQPQVRRCEQQSAQHVDHHMKPSIDIWHCGTVTRIDWSSGCVGAWELSKY